MATDILIDLGHFHPVDAEILLKIEPHFELHIRNGKKNVKFIYSEKASKFYEIFPLLLTIVHTVKSKWKILQNFMAFSEYMNFKKKGK